MVEQRQNFKTITPQILVGATPTRLSSIDLFVRTVIIESAQGNTGLIFISDSEANGTTLNRHVLYVPGDDLSITSSEYGGLNAEINLKQIWVHGTVPGDK